MAPHPVASPVAMASTSSKKRKAGGRAASSAQSPSLKKSRAAVASSSAVASVKVEVAPNDPEHDPVVVSFQRGIPSSVAENKSDDMPRFRCSRLRASSSRGRRVSGEDDGCSYSASAAGRGHDGRLTKAYVCVYDKRKKTLKVVPAAEKGTVFALEQSVKGYNPNVSDGGLLVGSGNMQDEDGKDRVMSAGDRVNLLVESFGSKKKQKVMASRAANKVNVHSVVGSGELMMKSVTGQEGISAENKKGMEEGSKMANPNDVAYEQARKKMLPPYDANADNPSKVYSAPSMAGEFAWAKVSRVVDLVLKQKAEGELDGMENWTDGLLGTNKGFYPKSVTSLLKSMDTSRKGSAMRVKAAFLLFTMLRLHHKISPRGKIPGASLDDCITGLSIPHDVGVRLFELFASPSSGEEGGYVASKQQRDRLCAHILVLYVIAAGREMAVPSINLLCRDMKMDVKNASLVLREAGFAVKKNSAGDFGASLTVPLKFPPPKRGKRT